MHDPIPEPAITPNAPDQRIDELVERLALASIDVDPRRCDPMALRLTARDMFELAALLETSDAGQ